MKKIIIGSDKAGFALKEHIKTHLAEIGYEVEDVGTQSVEQPVMYYETASRVAKRIQKGDYERGILICGTGMGVAQIADKYQGVYAAVCESVYAAFNCRSINDSNILCMGGNTVAPGNAVAMTDAFLNTEFTEGVPEERAAYLRQLRIDARACEAAIYG